MENNNKRRLVILSLGISDAYELGGFLKAFNKTNEPRINKILARIEKALNKLHGNVGGKTMEVPEQAEALATMRQEEGLVKEEQ